MREQQKGVNWELFEVFVNRRRIFLAHSNSSDRIELDQRKRDTKEVEGIEREGCLF